MTIRYKIASFALCAFVLVCSTFGLEAASAEQLENFHVFSVASHVKFGLKRTLQSAKRYGINVEVLGLGLPYRGNGQKLTYLKQYVKNMPDSDIVLFVDGFDILFFADANTILDTFLAMNAQFVISCEKLCFPAAVRPLAPQFPLSPTKLRYINSGSFMGYAGAIKKIVQGLEPIQEDFSDQAQFIRHFIKDPSLYTLDYHAKLFLPLMGLGEGNFVIDMEKKGVYCRFSKSNPCIFHGNSAGEIYLRKLHRMFYPFGFD